MSDHDIPSPFTLARDGNTKETTELQSLLGHELRAALKDIGQALSLIDMEPMPDAARGQLARARAAGETLSRLLDRALTVLDDAPRGMACMPEPVALVTLLDALEERWRPAAAARGLEFHIDFAAGTIGTLITDRLALERILANLLSLALEHAMPGSDGHRTALYLGVAPDAATGGTVLAVRAGQGRYPETLVAPATNAPATPGDALTVFITRDLARRIGARLTLVNAAGGGTEALLAMPQGALPVIPVDEPLPDLSGLRLLVLIASTSQRQSVAALLTMLGGKVTALADPDEAEALCAAGRIDLVLADADLPAGASLVVRLRKLPPPHCHMPILMLTGDASSGQAARLRGQGADGVLLRPVVCPVALGTAVLGAVAARSTTPARSTSAAGSAPPDRIVLPDARAHDPAPLRRLMELMGPDGADDLRDRLRGDLDALRKGIDAALTPPVDKAALRRQAHGLIALAGTCGATGLHQAGLLLHELARDLPGPTPDHSGLDGVARLDPILLKNLHEGFDALLVRIGYGTRRPPRT